MTTVQNLGKTLQTVKQAAEKRIQKSQDKANASLENLSNVLDAVDREVDKQDADVAAIQAWLASLTNGGPSLEDPIPLPEAPQQEPSSGQN